MGINVNWNPWSTRNEQLELERQRLRMEMANAALNEREKNREAQAKLAELSSNVAKAAQDRLANGEPREAVEAWAKSMHKAYGTGLTPKLVNGDDNMGGGYEFHGFMPGQEEPWKANPRKERQALAANRAAAIVAAEGGDPAAQGLLASAPQRALQTPEGQRVMGELGGSAWQSALGVMGGQPLGGMMAIATPQGQPTAPDDPSAAVAQQAALMGDDATLAFLQKQAQQNALYGNKMRMEAMRQQGLSERSSLAASVKLSLRGAAAKRARGEKLDPAEVALVESARKSAEDVADEYKGRVARKDAELAIALKPGGLTNTVSPEQQAEAARIRAEIAGLKTEFEAKVEPYQANYDALLGNVAKKKGVTVAPTAKRGKAKAAPVEGGKTGAAAPAATPRPGFKFQRNKKTGEVREVPI